MKELVNHFVEQLNDGVQISDTEGNICFMNSVAKKRLGIEGELENINVLDFEPIFESDEMWREHLAMLRQNDFLTIRSKNINLSTEVETPIEVTVFLREIGGKEYVFAISRNIEAVLETEDRLDRREKMLKAIAETSKELSFGMDFYVSISKSLPIIGEAVSVDRTYLFEFHTGAKNELLLSQRLEWNSGASDPQIDNPELQDLPAAMFQDFLDLLNQNLPFQAIIKNLPDSSDLKEILASQGILAILIMPVFHKGKLWGFIGYDDCSSERIWDEAEISILRTFSGNISLNIERQENLEEIQSFAAFPLQNPAPVIRLSESGDVLLRNHHSKEVEYSKFKMNGGEWMNFEDFSDILVRDVTSKLNDVFYYEIYLENGSHYSIIPKHIEERGYINLYFSNISVLKQTQDKLETAQQSIDRIVSNMRDVIWSIDMRTLELNFVSPSVYYLFDQSERELESSIKDGSFQKFLNEEDLKSIKDKLSHCNDIMDEVKIDVNGNKKWINLRIRAEKNDKGELERLDGYIIDITAKHIFEENIKLQERKFRGIIANMNLGLLEVDLEDHIIYVNDSFEKISGYSADELIGKLASEIFLDDSNKSEMQSKGSDRKRGESDSYEIKVNTKSGEERWWLISGAPNYDENGKLIGSLGIHLDITEQKKTQAKMQEATQIAEESNAAKELFIANMSHEIRTPLNAIVGLSQQLKRYQQDPEGREYTDYIISSSNHLQSLIDNILDFSKINAGKFQLQETYFDLGKVYHEIKSIMLPLAESKDLELISSLDNEVFNHVYADRTRIKQVLINILSNAIKFTDSGHVVFEIKKAHSNGTIQVLSIHILDTGIGMSQDFLSRIFDKFSQADSSSKRKESGTGLGMAITSELLRLMKGTIEIDSEPGRGTSMRLEIPVVCNFDIASDEKDIMNEKVDFSNKRVLVVEDNQLNMLVTRGFLKKYNIDPVEAKDGFESLQCVQNEDFDLILMDVQMPKMDGIEATKVMIEEHGIKTPIVALSANAFKSDINRCIDAGMVDYLTKPFREDDFVHKLAKYLNGSESNSEEDNSIDTNENLISFTSIEMLPENDRANIIEAFISESKSTVNQLKDSQEHGDFEKIKFFAHKLKSNIKLFEIKSLYVHVKELENHANDLSNAEIQKRINEIDAVLNVIFEKIEKGLK